MKSWKGLRRAVRCLQKQLPQEELKSCNLGKELGALLPCCFQAQCLLQHQPGLHSQKESSWDGPLPRDFPCLTTAPTVSQHCQVALLGLSPSN